MKTYKICLLAGDGIGPEVTKEGMAVLRDAAARFGFALDVEEAYIGGTAYEQCGQMLPEATITAAKNADAVLLGAVGGPRWDQLPAAERCETALLGIRAALGLYANLRPATLFKALAAASPLRSEQVEKGIDIMIVRELTGGIYFGERGRGLANGEEFAYDTEKYSKSEIRRIALVAFESALKRGKKLCSVDKANVLESSRLWRETLNELAAEYPEVELSHLYVDNASMQLIRRPSSFDVIVTSNMFGDILSDEAAEITGSIGLLPSASLGESGRCSLYEPIHGSAPDIAGKNSANPLATILSVAMLCRYALGEESAALAIEAAVEKTLDQGYRSADLLNVGKTDGQQLLSCTAMGARVRENLRQDA